jgi:hypothetical protein
MTLTEFLLARIAEDEAAARKEDADYANTTLLPTYDSEHQLRWNTERVLAECAAKRRIVERFRPAVAVVYRESDRLLASAFNETRVPILAHSAPFWPNEHAEATLRDLALPYRDHSDYDEAWRP